MLHCLRRHPFPVRAHFGHSLVLTYAFPEAVLTPLLPPGLVLDTYEGLGFVAIALVQTHGLRPSFLPRLLGQDFFLSGYRIFTRLGNAAGSLRGLRIIRSDTDRWSMKTGGNLFTHYRYELADVQMKLDGSRLDVKIRTGEGKADLDVSADLGSKPASLPAGSPFASLKDARRFAGPLPYTFDYEAETHSIVSIRGVREEWDPQPVAVEVRQAAFLSQPWFQGVRPILANAFHLQEVPYRWERGVLRQVVAAS